MPESGLLESARLPHVEVSSDAAPPPWHIPEAVVQTITYEVPVLNARRHLPDIVTRSAPTYARVTVIDRADSPIGPYREAVLMIGCRIGMLPANYVVGAVADREAACEAIAAHWRYQPSLGEISIVRSDDAITSRIDAGDGLSVQLHSPITEAAAVAIVRYDPLLTIIQQDGGPTAAEVPCEHDVRQAWLSRGSSLSYDGGSRSHPWIRLRSSNAITAVAAIEGQTIEASAVAATPGATAGG